VTFRRVSERVVHEGRARYVIATFEAPDGGTFEREIVRSPGAVAVVALDDAGRVRLVRQFRAAIGATLLEIPAGLLDVEGEPPLDCAKRELAEEAGLDAEHWQELTCFVNAVGMTDQTTRIYLARTLLAVESSPQGVEEEAMTLEWLALDDAVAQIRAGEITDAKTVIGILLAANELGAVHPSIRG
jgi:8-oxo-dGDP phosphatase